MHMLDVAKKLGLTNEQIDLLAEFTSDETVSALRWGELAINRRLALERQLELVDNDIQMYANILRDEIKGYQEDCLTLDLGSATLTPR